MSLIVHSPESISVIIPALNEVLVLAKTLESLRSSRFLEAILVDGGSSDDTRKVASQHDVSVLLSSPGRARQMNLGSAAASGSILLFLHADTCLPPHFDTYVRDALSSPNVVAGAFELRIDATNPALRWIERMANWRSRRLHMPYGDQAIFVRADVFRSLGGFPELPIMEDFELMRRLRGRGGIAILPQPALTSARRWKEAGVLKTTLANQLIILAYLAGVPPARIARWYQRHKRSQSSTDHCLETRSQEL
ncbi:MAG: TIGR04283 family arsenosugar biosynthesis glycosyltransferase [Acidobacteria bacterium]|nr:TIGR04283 family arsenosugar biosynthesis glycosyltransferase [Acidobacteriota bacterium]MCI0720312.1 TIGR04283 family arsenosugar biosynthesis glycosyltransferase [Acidobacteriota bacterium]